MAKPQWLLDAEREKTNKVKFTPRTCGECAHWENGDPVTMVKVLGQTGKHLQRECPVHLGCLNTRFAYACGDWSKLKI